MSTPFESTFHNPYIAVLVGAAVSLDVIALTFCSPHIFLGNRKTWLRWALYNAGWHAGLLLVYLLVIDVAAVGAQFVGYALDLKLPTWLSGLQPVWAWIADRFRTHIVIYAALVAMAFVWWQYTGKVAQEPTRPDPNASPFFLRALFSKRRAQLADRSSKWFWHLSACLVAVDMLALAAVVKSGEKLVEFPSGLRGRETSLSDLTQQILATFDNKFFMASGFIVVAVYLIVGCMSFMATWVSRNFWDSGANSRRLPADSLEAHFVVVALRLLEPTIIFYFIIHSMAFLATGIPMHSPAFLLGSGLLVAALIQFVGFSKVAAAAQAQVAMVMHNDNPEDHHEQR